jgi:hypothetical protein
VSITHIAGPDITIDGEFGQYLRQRCGWCGAVLLEYELARVAVPVDQPGPPATWPLNAFVRLDGNLSTVRAHTEDRKLPFDACARNPATLPGWSG